VRVCVWGGGLTQNDNAEYAEQYAQQQAMLYEQQGGDGYDVGSDEEEAFNRMYAQQQAMGYGVQGMYDGEEVCVRVCHVFLGRGTCHSCGHARGNAKQQPPCNRMHVHASLHTRMGPL
jgi:hypothetical protein